MYPLIFSKRNEYREEEAHIWEGVMICLISAE